MKNTILLLITVFCVNGFAEEVAVDSGDPNLIILPGDQAATAAMVLSSSTNSNLTLAMKSGYEIKQKLKETENTNTVPEALAKRPIQIESHSSKNTLLLVPSNYLKLLSNTPEAGSEGSLMKDENSANNEAKEGAQ